MKKIKYIIYYVKHKIQHKGMKMTPVCYNEWLDNEYKEE